MLPHLPQLPPPLIGELEEPLPELKIKDNADHAGLSQQPVF